MRELFLVSGLGVCGEIGPRGFGYWVCEGLGRVGCVFRLKVVDVGLRHVFGLQQKTIK